MRDNILWVFFLVLVYSLENLKPHMWLLFYFFGTCCPSASLWHFMVTQFSSPICRLTV